MFYNKSVTAICDAVADSDVAGYRFYAGIASRVYSTGFTTSSTSPQATISGLLNGTTYYFGATAFDTSNNESTFSNEVSQLITIPVLQLLRRVV